MCPNLMPSKRNLGKYLENCWIETHTKKNRNKFLSWGEYFVISKGIVSAQSTLPSTLSTKPSGRYWTSPIWDIGKKGKTDYKKQLFCL